MTEPLQKRNKGTAKENNGVQSLIRFRFFNTVHMGTNGLHTYLYMWFRLGLCTIGSSNSRMVPILRWVSSPGSCILGNLTASWMRSQHLLLSLSLLELIRFYS